MKKQLFKGFAALAAFGALLWGGICHAAVDADLTAATASTTSFLTDNKSAIISFFVGIVLLVLIIKLVFVLVNRGSRMIVGGVSGGRRRRR